MFLKEQLSFDAAQMLVEASDEKDANGKKKLYMSGICIQGGVRNHNGRVYPVSEIRAAVEKVNKTIQSGFSFCGEADHPEELTVSVKGVSHAIQKMWMEGNAGYGKMLVLPTPNGEIVRTLIESQVKLGVSSRGTGNVDNSGNVSDFDMVAIDFVMNPSGPDCFPDPIFESLRKSKSGRIIAGLSEAVLHDPKAQKHLQKELFKMIGNLK